MKKKKEMTPQAGTTASHRQRHTKRPARPLARQAAEEADASLARDLVTVAAHSTITGALIVLLTMKLKKLEGAENPASDDIIDQATHLKAEAESILLTISSVKTESGLEALCAKNMSKLNGLAKLSKSIKEMKVSSTKKPGS
jgi:hypothetical protein